MTCCVHQEKSVLQVESLNLREKILGGCGGRSLRRNAMCMALTRVWMVKTMSIDDRYPPAASIEITTQYRIDFLSSNCMPQLMTKKMDRASQRLVNGLTASNVLLTRSESKHPPLESCRKLLSMHADNFGGVCLRNRLQHLQIGRDTLPKIYKTCTSLVSLSLSRMAAI